MEMLKNVRVFWESKDQKIEGYYISELFLRQNT